MVALQRLYWRAKYENDHGRGFSIGDAAGAVALAGLAW